MADDLTALQSLIDALPPRRCLTPASLTAMISPDNYLNLLGGATQLPAFSGPWMLPTAQQLEQLATKLVGNVGQADGNPAPVINALTAASDDPTGLPAALMQLLALSWPGRWKVLSTLGTQSTPSVVWPDRTAAVLPPGSLSVLDKLDPVNVPAVATVGNDEANATIIAALLVRGNRGPIVVNEITHWWGLVSSLGSLALRAQLEIFAALHVPTDVAEGIVAWVDSERMEASAGASSPLVLPAASLPPWAQQLETLWKSIDADADTWLDANYTPPWLFALRLGSAVHRIIAAYYIKAHTVAYGETSSYRMWTNSVPIQTIVRALEERFDEEFSDIIAVALALSRPDIFELGELHGQPPGWVYEIKPWQSSEVAIAEAEFYAAALLACGVPVLPGPVALGGGPVPGTVSLGQVPCPGGWVVWTCAGPGAIGYRFKPASEEALEARGVQAAKSDVKNQLNELIATLPPSSTTTEIAAGAGILAVLYYLMQGLRISPAFAVP